MERPKKRCKNCPSPENLPTPNKSSSMASLHRHEDDVTLDSAPYCFHDMHSFDVYGSDSESPMSNLGLGGPQITALRQRHPNRIRGSDDISGFNSISNVDFFDCHSQVNFVMDSFQQRVEQSLSVVGGDNDFASNLDLNFGVIEGNEEMCSNHLELDLGLGLGLGFCRDWHGLAEDDDGCGFMVANPSDDFFMSGRGSVSESCESSTVSGDADQFLGNMRVVGIDSDSEEDEIGVLGIDLNSEDDYNVWDDNTGLGIHLDSLQFHLDSFPLEDQRNGNEGFEWEEVDGRVNEREVMSMFFADIDEDLDALVSDLIRSQEEGLLNVHNFESNTELEHEIVPYLEDQDYEMIFGQLTENENAFVVRPSASTTIVKNLPSVVLTQEDLDNNDVLCAVCKDDINAGEQAKQLPCFHRYHGDCILPWLNIRNTCPVCRYELPTDDPDYERRRTQRADCVQ
ncbi:uncharacterized protein LOC132285803 [Cornus florida]|uniref:uncharacterized protein LOC132285803 n=1 Tax=Cornus florida TaxID=4283 RepID=UPI00289D872F|nr:uncharacterized protein LOC132285803 [Cornus florida]